MKQQTKKIDPQQMLDAYEEVLEPVQYILSTSPEKIRNIIKELKQHDGEHWAVGEMLDRARILYSAIYVSEHQ